MSFAAGSALWSYGCSSATWGSSSRVLPDPVVETAESTVAVRAWRDGSPVSWGGGLLLDGGCVLTVAHLVEGADHWELVGRYGRRTFATRVAEIDPALDLALLAVDPAARKGLPWRPARIAGRSELEGGTSVWVIGRNSGTWRTAIGPVAPGCPLFGVDGASQGDSGAAVVDAGGRVLGLVTQCGGLTLAVSLAGGVPDLSAATYWPVPTEERDSGLLWGAFAAHAGQWPRAAGYFRAAQRARPDDPLVEAWLGRALLETGETEEAARTLERVADANPGDARVRHNLGVARHRSGRLEEALESYRAALGLDPDDVETWSNLTAALKELGRTAEAEEAAERARRGTAPHRLAGP